MSLKTQDLFNVSNKVVVVTGGSRGIGEMITSGFLANKSKVYITARKEEALVNIKKIASFNGVKNLEIKDLKEEKFEVID